jgi:hypothetical protein
MAKRRVTMRVDRAKLETVKQILGRKTITATVDSALDEVLKQESGQSTRRGSIATRGPKP